VARVKVREALAVVEARVQRVLDHYEGQSDEEAVAEDESSFEATTHTAMEVPIEASAARDPARDRASPWRAGRRDSAGRRPGPWKLLRNRSLTPRPG
jgi:hypothetical protein